MRFKWIDYSEEYDDIVESWLDEEAVRLTGIDDGFREYFKYWISDSDTKYGENFWVKVIFENEKPIGVLAIGLWEGEFTIAEIIISPYWRRKGIGSSAISEWIECSSSIIGVSCQKANAVIFPNNIASQKAFEKAGFKFVSAHPDGDAWYYEYNAE